MGTNLSSVSGKSVTKPAALSLARWWLRIAQRQLGEVLERQHVELAVPGQRVGSVQVIAPEPRTVADRDRRVRARRHDWLRRERRVSPLVCLVHERLYGKQDE